MSKTSLIIKREYLTRVKKRSFLVVTFLVPILFVAVIAGVAFLAVSDQSSQNILIVDHDKILSNEINGNIVPINAERWKNKSDSSVLYTFSHSPYEPDTFLESDYTLQIDIDKQTIQDPNIPLLFKELPSLNVSQSLERKIQDDLQEYKFMMDSITPERYKELKVEVNLVEQDATSMEVEDPHMRDRGWLGYALSMVIYITIFLFGSQVMRGVLEEKMNRIVEVLISSVKPFQLLMGKITGVGLVGLTQLLLWIILFGLFFVVGSVLLGSSISPDQMAAYTENGAAMGDVSSYEVIMKEAGMGNFYNIATSIPWTKLILSFVFYFLGGYLLYGSFLAAVGSAVDAEADSQQFMMPITLPLIAAIMLAQLVIVNPESTIATVFSHFPLTSPVVMLVRVAMDTASWGELLISMSLLILAFIGSVWLAGKIYRTGILMYGKKASWKELYKWLKY